MTLAKKIVLLLMAAGMLLAVFLEVGDLVAHLDSCPRRISMHAISCVHAEHQRDALKGLGIRLPITNCSWRTF